ncbi:hypothetical protein K9N68_14995 [Kovacikia minuta CCNUW1]|uniref:hypothetical protein n=1 Tax=Kovacikia minuta TaxID=2931930 RepID=UPI001CC9A281|nr:hypothetical protein [Kovacikia minuta]UBF29024.1 hypothetical protein K9N68_14995 [Kovacikia minuta CCNUW1]
MQNTSLDLSREEGFDSDKGEQLGRFPVESYADRLMDELFEDVEGMLDGGPKPQIEPEALEVEATPQPAVSTNFFGLSLPTPFSNQDSATKSDPELESNLVNGQFADSSLEQMPAPVEQKPASQSYNRLLLGIGCVSLIATTGLWFLFQEMKRQPATVSLPPQTTANAPAQVGDPFASYMQRSLQAIDQKHQPSGSPGTTTTHAPAASSLPTVTVPGSQISGTAPAPSIPGVPTLGTAKTPAATGRIYIPVYQAPPGSPSAPTATAPNVTPLPNPPTSTGSTAVRTPIPLSVPGVARTLEGVVDMGEQSAILVKINGVTQRFRLGESIGSSGWALVEVSKNQAIVRRNGEVRSLFIGQSF